MASEILKFKPGYTFLKINLLLFFLLVCLLSCKDKIENPNALFSISINENKKGFTNNDAITVRINNKKNSSIDQITYTIGETSQSVTTNNEVTFSLKNFTLGEKNLTATIKSDGNSYVVNTPITILSSVTPQLYSYKIVETYPHDIEAYTQGLEFDGDVLYESTGQYGKSSIRKTKLETGEVLLNKPLENQFFGEGLTIVDDKVIQLTWKENQGFIYNKENLTPLSTFTYNNSREGWGLANDGSKIYKSDGTHKIWTLNKNTLAEESFVEMYTNTSRINAVNEMEFVDGLLYANIYQKEAIAIVDPQTGAVQGVINLKGLKEKVTQHNKLDVLNGIAYKGEKNMLYVTGKNWDKLFKIEIFKN